MNEVVEDLRVLYKSANSEVLFGDAGSYKRHCANLIERVSIAEREVEKLRVDVAFEKDRPAAELPRLVACALILKDGMVLLEKRAPAGVVGLDDSWDLPGGKVESGETVQQATEREIREELNVQIAVDGLCSEPFPSTWSYPGKGDRHWLLVGVICHIVSGTPRLSERLQWFPISNLPSEILQADKDLIVKMRERDALQERLRRMSEPFTFKELERYQVTAHADQLLCEFINRKIAARAQAAEGEE